MCIIFMFIYVPIFMYISMYIIFMNVFNYICIFSMIYLCRFLNRMILISSKTALNVCLIFTLQRNVTRSSVGLHEFSPCNAE